MAKKSDHRRMDGPTLLKSLFVVSICSVPTHNDQPIYNLRFNQVFASLPEILLLFMLVLIAALTTEFTSNSSTATIFMPILISLAGRCHIGVFLRDHESSSLGVPYYRITDTDMKACGLRTCESSRLQFFF